MKIELKQIPIREIVKNYVNNNEEGVIGYDKRLNIRPAYQREFIYNDCQRDAVIETIKKDFPLNVMYWAKNSDNSYEIMDGQQRTVSICEYVKGKFSLNYQYFHNLEPEEQNQILDYELFIYFCEGRNKEKLDWFKTINIAGEKLSNQELRNAVYTGKWLSDSKKYFSKTTCPAYNIAKDYLKGVSIRQDYLETVLSWISNNNIEQYMADNQNKSNANALILYFNEVINWVKTLFPVYRKEMKGIDWGILYNNYKTKEFGNSDEIEFRISELMSDDDVTKKQGIYNYIITGDEKHLNIRQFSESMRRTVYEKQNGICMVCGNHFKFEEMEADHVVAWHEGGKTVLENCQMLCKADNRKKSGK